MVTYGSLNLTEGASPAATFNEVLSLEAVKKFLNLPERSPIDELEDAELEAFIIAARDTAEGAQGRDLVPKQYDLSLDCFLSCTIALRDPLVSVDLVRYRDSAGDYYELEADVDYIVDTSKHPGVILPAYGRSWPTFTPWPSSAVLVRFTAGYAADSVFWTAGPGVRIRQGMLLLIGAWFSKRIPFQEGATPIEELPFGISACLSAGALLKVA